MSRPSAGIIITGPYPDTNLSTHVSENYIPKSIKMSTPHGRTHSTSPWPPGYDVKIVGGKRIVIWKEEVDNDRSKRWEKIN